MAFQRLFLPATTLVLIVSSFHAQPVDDDKCCVDSAAVYQPPKGCPHPHPASMSPPPAGSSESSVAFQSFHKSTNSTRAQNHQISTASGIFSTGTPPPAPAPTRPPPPRCEPSPQSATLLCCCANIEYVATEFYTQASMGRTMDYLDSSLAGNCTDPPRGGEKAYLSPSAEDMMRQIAYQSLDHLKAIQLSLGSNKSCNRPGIDVSCSRFSRIVNDAMGHTLWPDFDWYKNDYTTLLGAYWFSGLLTKCYTGILDRCEGPATNRLCGSLAAAKARQEMVIRTVLYQNFQHNVYPYKISVAEFTNRLSRYKDKLAGSNGTADEGLWVPSCLGTGGSNSNMFSADSYGLPFSYNVTDGCDVVKAVLGPMAYNYK